MGIGMERVGSLCDLFRVLLGYLTLAGIAIAMDGKTSEVPTLFSRFRLRNDIGLLGKIQFDDSR